MLFPKPRTWFRYFRLFLIPISLEVTIILFGPLKREVGKKGNEGAGGEQYPKEKEELWLERVLRIGWVGWTRKSGNQPNQPTPLGPCYIHVLNRWIFKSSNLQIVDRWYGGFRCVCTYVRTEPCGGSVGGVWCTEDWSFRSISDRSQIRG